MLVEAVGLLLWLELVMKKLGMAAASPAWFSEDVLAVPPGLLTKWVFRISPSLQTGQDCLLRNHFWRHSLWYRWLALRLHASLTIDFWDCSMSETISPRQMRQVSVLTSASLIKDFRFSEGNLADNSICALLCDASYFEF